MKRIVNALLVGIILMLPGCLETTEITLKADGSGEVTITADISALATIMKSMPGSVDEKTDTTFQLGVWENFMGPLNAGEKEMVRTGFVRTNFDPGNEIQIVSFTFPFARQEELPALKKFSNKIMFRFIERFMPAKSGSISIDRIAQCTPFDDYFNITYTNEQISRNIILEKFSGLKNDTCFIAMKNAAEMGFNFKSTRIIHLPRPAKKAEGENITLSNDKKTVTIKVSPDDFYKDPEKMGFRIEY